MGDAGMYKSFKETTAGIPGMKEEVVRRFHEQIFPKIINACAGIIYKQFHYHFIVHYSKTLNIEFRNFCR